MKRKSILGIILAAAVLSSVFLFSGCTSSKSPDKIVIAEFRTLGWLSSHVADELGYFKDEGLDAEFVNFKDGPLAFQSLQSGDADFVLMSIELPLRAYADGQESIFIAAVQKTRQYMLIAQDKFTDISQLEGATVFAGTPGSTPYTFVCAVLEDAGVDINSINFVNTDYGSAIVSLAEGNIDASYLGLSYLPDFEKIHTGHILFSTADPKTHLEFFGSPTSEGEIIACNKKLRDEHPETVQKYANALVRAMQWMEVTDSHEIAELLLDRYDSMTLEELEERIELLKPALSYDGYITEEGYDALLRFCKKYNIIDEDVPYDVAVDMSFIENANASH